MPLSTGGLNAELNCTIVPGFDKYNSSANTGKGPSVLPKKTVIKINIKVLIAYTISIDYKNDKNKGGNSFLGKRLLRREISKIGKNIF